MLILRHKKTTQTQNQKTSAENGSEEAPHKPGPAELGGGVLANRHELRIGSTVKDISAKPVSRYELDGGSRHFGVDSAMVNEKSDDTVVA